MDEIPVTILSGPLGAGKTTVVNHLLHNSGGRSIAVLVNDMGEVNVDAELLSAGTDIADGGVAELSNGCICCELQDDLETEVARLAAERDFEYLVVESSGISEPEPVARLFTTDSRAAAAYVLDTTVTVVDTARFLDTFGGADHVERETAPGSEDRPLSDLLVEQIEFADVILLNKADLVDDDALSRATELVATVAPRATILTTTHGEVDAGKILGTGLFDPAETGAGVGWGGAVDDHDDTDHGDPDNEHADAGHDHADHGHHEHAHPDEVYGVTSFIYSRRRPFHPRRIRELLGSLPPSVVRSKGLFWVAGREETAFLLSQAGPNTRVEVFGPWLASLPKVERDLYRSNRSEVEWDDDHGDRRTELVFIGQNIDEDALVDRLDDCLVTDDEWGDAGESGLFPDGDDALEFPSRDSG
jgi:G3E family GTPase